MQLVRIGRGQFRRFRAADKAGDGERLNPDVLEPQRGQAGNRPVARLGLTLRPGRARADLGRQAFGDLPGQIVALVGKRGGGSKQGGERGGAEQVSHRGWLSGASALGKPADQIA